ncbi:MAG TPA: GreA/GreB family elongation factor [Myxococcota bacterium]|nr:GreA/GreB family elongation factor [Myxococcota bacterium]
MSKAFTDEEAAPLPPIVRPRAPLPEGVPNYVTERGLALLRAELAGLEPAPEAKGDLAAADAAALAQRRAELEARIASAEVVAPPEDAATIRFGARVTVAGASGERSWQIVGVDEADAAQGRISFASPLARALLGRAAGDTVRVRTPRGDEELEIVAVSYP